MENYYQILGISQNATSQEIKQAYHLRLKQNKLLHAQEDGLLSSKQYIDLTAAYNALANQEKKEEYDRILNSILTESQYRALKKTQGTHMAVLPATHLVRRRLTKGLMVYGTAALGIILIIAFGIYKKGKFSSLDLSPHQGAADNAQVAITGGQLEPEYSALPAASNASSPDRSVAMKEAKQEPRNPGRRSSLPAELSTVAVNRHPSTQSPSTVAVPSAPPTQPETSNVADLGSPATTTTGLNNKDRVLATWGTPKSIIRYGDKDEIWQYATNTVYFHDGKITSRQDSVLLN